MCRSLSQTALVQCTYAIVKSTITPYYKNKYERLAKRRDKKRAIIAFARITLTTVYQMLSTGETWNPCDLYRTDKTANLRGRNSS